MSAHVKALPREFRFNGVALPDPAPQASPDEVKALLAHQYPDVLTATMEGPRIEGGRAVYTLERAVGAKG
ncbi:MAG: PRTRC system protein C [Gemmatimonadaceae bacterium]|nr:PRTRC system protein C [Gemmatimonadaceae bacterium]